MQHIVFVKEHNDMLMLFQKTENKVERVRLPSFELVGIFLYDAKQKRLDNCVF